MQGTKHASLIFAVILCVCIDVISLCACVGLSHLHYHIAVNYDKVCFVNRFSPIWCHTHMGEKLKLLPGFWKSFGIQMGCHGLISSISRLPFLTFFSKYEGSEMKPYVVSRNQVNSRASAGSCCSRGGGRETEALEDTLRDET